MARHRKSFDLPGAYTRRVFIGGSYHGPTRRLLNEFATIVRAEGFEPVIADDYPMTDEQIHDLTLALLHACRYALFEVSEMSGALMEVERTRDYGTRTLLLFHGASAGDWRVSRMLSSFIRQEDPMVKALRYLRPATARTRVRRRLQGIKRTTL